MVFGSQINLMINSHRNKLQKSKGLVIYEVILILIFTGLLLLLLFPVYKKAENKAAQKATIKDISIWARAIEDYLIDHQSAPTNPKGELSIKKQFIIDIAPYMKYLRFLDWWGNRLSIWIGRNNPKYGISFLKPTDFVIASFGRDGIKELWKFNPASPQQGWYKVKTLKDFNKDIVLFNGKFIRCPY